MSSGFGEGSRDGSNIAATEGGALNVQVTLDGKRERRIKRL